MYGESGLADELVCLFNKVWETEQIPQDWSKGVIVVIERKGIPLIAQTIQE